ncbi:hypothetical protein AB4359_17925 [Vibrio splendidus]
MLNQYIELVNATEKVEYDNSNSVKSSNSAVDKMYSIVRSASGVELENLFELLEHSLAKKWLAHQLIECHSLPIEIEDKCISIVESLAKEGTLNSFGEEIWLKEWKPKLGRA